MRILILAAALPAAAADTSSRLLPRSTPEAQGLPASAVPAFGEAAEAGPGVVVEDDGGAQRCEVPDRCGVCGGELVRRDDDTAEALANRLRDYHRRTDPVLELFAGKEFVVTVDARPDPDTVQRGIRQRLGLPPATR